MICAKDLNGQIQLPPQRNSGRAAKQKPRDGDTRQKTYPPAQDSRSVHSHIRARQTNAANQNLRALVTTSVCP